MLSFDPNVSNPQLRSKNSETTGQTASNKTSEDELLFDKKPETTGQVASVPGSMTTVDPNSPEYKKKQEETAGQVAAANGNKLDYKA